ESLNLLRQLAEELGQARSVVVKVDEHPQPPFRDTHRPEAEIFEVEILSSIHLGSVQQTPIERICPPVIPAAKGFSVSTAHGWRPGTVPTNVVKPAQFSAFVARDQQRLSE